MPAEATSKLRGGHGTKTTQFCFSDREEHLMYFEDL